MSVVGTIVRRELSSYFATPIAYVFIVVFLVMSALLSFYLGNLYQRGQADLLPFFKFHPWLYLFFVPAITMRLWSEERSSGNIELLLTLPVKKSSWVIGKFLAAWLFIGLTLLLTFPMVITINYLGNPDNGMILAGYLGSFLLAGGFLAIGSCLSALNKNQVVAFIVTVVVCFLFLLASFPVVLSLLQSFLPQVMIEMMMAVGFLTHFESISKGVLDFADLCYFGLLIGLWLMATVIVLEMKKGA